jgi:large subunit ribosomal protein L23
MGIFNRIKGTRQDAPKEEKDESPKKNEAAAEETHTPVKAKGGRYGYAVLSPRVSEKAAVKASAGTYVFNVPVDATKIEIRKAIESLFKVNVVSVRTVRNIGKQVRRGRIVGRRIRTKKAYVALKTGQKIEVYEGV